MVKRKEGAGSARPTAEVHPSGVTHQTTDNPAQVLTTNQGTGIADNQNSLKTGYRGPTLLEDFILREKITSFDHERIPERVVHARGSGAHGYFELTKPIPHLTKAKILTEAGKKTEVFVRFSTVAGGAGSGDLPRDVRGFAVRFYTDQGNWDLVGNNIPVFFIQDAIKFPDLIHSVKMEADRGYPQAASAHDTFWDWASLMPESVHMQMWVMSDRAIPRSLRMMEGFGIHTFRLLNEAGESTFVKFHWRPTIGSASVVWDEALKINGADPDFHRRDLYDAIDKGNYPEFEFGIQSFTEKQAESFGFDVLDSTKLIPEELVPVEIIGKMVLDRNPDNFFAETEQVAFHPASVVPGIDFTNDPLLQGRLFSYVDTQLLRLGGPNFHEIPINRARVPIRNFQRDGFKRMETPKGRVNYEPQSLDPSAARESPSLGYASYPAPESGEKVRARSESFADHYSQARLFYRSQSEPEQRHMQAAFAFELGKVSVKAIRTRELGHLKLVDEGLAEAVADLLGMAGQADATTPARQPVDMPDSPALSLVKKAPATIKGRKVGVLVTDGFDDALLKAVKKAIVAEGAEVDVVAPKVGGATSKGGSLTEADHALAGAPSVLFDAVILLPSAAGVEMLAKTAAAIDWIRDAFGHLKVIGYAPAAKPLFEKAGIAKDLDNGVIAIGGESDLSAFIAAAKQQRIWAREPHVRPTH